MKAHTDRNSPGDTQYGNDATTGNMDGQGDGGYYSEAQALNSTPGLNQNSMQNLSRAGVNVPDLGVSGGGNDNGNYFPQQRQPQQQPPPPLHQPTPQSAAQTAQANELQQRFANMNLSRQDTESDQGQGYQPQVPYQQQPPQSYSRAPHDQSYQQPYQSLSPQQSWQQSTPSSVATRHASTSSVPSVVGKKKPPPPPPKKKRIPIPGQVQPAQRQQQQSQGQGVSYAPQLPFGAPRPY
ncbi:hypothetical protein KEM56_002415 [Ascosphaera pollenicola]|nr:hypothetical protein KEM56_002415 [Ascosphaera pollenicola]